jgi:hypothetical protein
MFLFSLCRSRLTCFLRELRQMFQYIRLLVEKRFDAEKKDMRWQSVSAFCFLRFIVPSILHPHMFGLCQGKPYFISSYSFLWNLILNPHSRHASEPCTTFPDANRQGNAESSKFKHCKLVQENIHSKPYGFPI